MKHYDVVIIGSGISGLTYARLLQKYTNKTFIILEKEPTVGGLCRSINVDGNHFDVGGGHFLYSKHQHVYDFIFSHIPITAFNKYDRVTKIKIHDTYIGYPFEQNIWQLPKKQQYKYLCSLVDSAKLVADPKNFEDWILKNLGSEIFENYLKPYNEKIWGIPVNEMSTSWMSNIPAVDLKKILHSIIFQQADKQAIQTHSYFYYPKEGGFQRIIDAIYEPLKDYVLCNTLATSLVYIKSKFQPHWMINGKYMAHTVINTIAWGALPLTHPPNIESAINNLKHNSIAVSLKKEQYKNDWQWCYIPDKDTPEHREFFVNNYAENNQDQCKAYETNLTRFTDKQKNGSLACHINEYAYPIPTHGHEEHIKQVLDYYGGLNMHGLGRWGQWQYHNSDVCIDNAFKLFEKLERKIL